MVKNGQAPRRPIADLNYRQHSRVGLGMEVLTLTDLAKRVDEAHLLRIHRPTFHHLVRVRRGTLRTMVDFDELEVPRHGWLWIRPGQVHRWGDLSRVDATLVLFRREFLSPPTAALAGLDGVGDLGAPVVMGLGGAALDDARRALAELEHSWSREDTPSEDARAAVLRHQLSVLVLHLAHECRSHRGVEPLGTFETFDGFRRAVEEGFGRSRRVEDYASELGWSVRTLTRATREATGLSAKEFIDRRVVLEAERLLAHTDLTATRVASLLGFDSATNFGKFFTQRSGRSPGAFRAEHRRTG
jgi:AraC-like DNA-binding protein